MCNLTQLYAIVVTIDGHEVIMRRDFKFGTQPMIADSLARLQPFIPEAALLAAQHGWQWSIVRFDRAGHSTGKHISLGGNAPPKEGASCHQVN